MTRFLKKNFNFVLLPLSILPALITGILIIKNWVNFPPGDHWNTPGEDLVNLVEGNFQLDQLFRQHNEHRLLVYRILSIPIALLTHWDVRYEIAIMFMIACGISLSIFKLIKTTCDDNLTRQILLTIPINLLIFSPVQTDPTGNWLTGFQLSLFLPILCLCICLLIAYSQWTVSVKFLGCIMLSLVATFSSGNGLLLWVLVFPPLLLISSSSWREILGHIKLVFFWIFAFAITVYAYFYNYQATSSSDKRLIFVKPVYSLSYFLSLLGRPLGSGNLLSNQIIGVFLLLLFLGILSYIFIYRTDFVFLKRTCGWLTLSVFSLCSNFLIMTARSGDGILTSLFAKYTTISLYFIVSLIPLSFLVLSHASFRKITINYKNILRSFLITVVIVFLTLHYLSFRQGVQWMNIVRVSRLSGKACLLLVNLISDDQCLANHVYPLIEVNGWNSIEYVKETSNKLSQAGLLTPKLIDTTKIQEINHNENLTTSEGTFQQMYQSEGKYVASGIFSHRLHPNIGAIVLAYGDGNEATIFVASQLSPLNMNWQVSFSPEQIPHKPALITAWALDTDTGKMYKLSQPTPLWVK